jgi:PAT family beta-lactamase induction signal transducer AmpG
VAVGADRGDRQGDAADAAGPTGLPDIATPVVAVPRIARSKLFWVGVLYLAEGLPFGIFYDVLPVWFRQQGVDLRSIGLLSLLGLGWTLKFLWAPAIDRWRHHRRWMAGADLVMAAIMVAFALVTAAPDWAFLLIALFTLASATNDIAIDAYTIELLEANEMGLANGVRNGMYRVGIIGAGSALVLSTWAGWPVAFAACAAVLAVSGAVMLAAPPERARAGLVQGSLADELRALARSPRACLAVCGLALATLWLVDRVTRWSSVWPTFWWVAGSGALAVAVLVFVINGRQRPARATDGTAQASAPAPRGPLFGALFELLERPGIVPVIAFVLLYKLGDAAMGFMVKPFWVDRGFSAAEIGLVSVNIGLALAIAGGLVGGWYTDRAGIGRALWVLGLAQAFSNLAYAAVAWALPEGMAAGSVERSFIYAASAFESFTGGLGSAAFLAFLMAIVDRRRSAAEYALLSSIFALSRSVAGWAGGFGAHEWGYAAYFLLTFVLSFPAFLLLPAAWRMLAARAPGPDSSRTATS